MAGRKGAEEEQSLAPYLADISLKSRNGGLQESPLKQNRTSEGRVRSTCHPITSYSAIYATQTNGRCDSEKAETSVPTRVIGKTTIRK